MDNELRLIRYLYGEEEQPEEVEQLLAADSILRAEYRQLKATKDRLDARPGQCPDAEVVDRVVAAATQSASEPSSVERGRADREPVARTRTPRRRVLGVTSALAVMLVVVSIGIWQWDGDFPGSISAEIAADAQSVTEQRSDDARDAGEEASLPAWDEADNDVVRLHHYIETLHVRSSPNSWDSPGASLQPASQVRSSSDR